MRYGYALQHKNSTNIYQTETGQAEALWEMKSKEMFGIKRIRQSYVIWIYENKFAKEGY